MSHWVGVGVQAPSRPQVIVYSPKPVSWRSQPNPWPIRRALRLRTDELLLTAPCILPNVWPPTVSATVSSSFIAIRLNVSRMSWADASDRARRWGPAG